jgi:hypothetical protein
MQSDDARHLDATHGRQNRTVALQVKNVEALRAAQRRADHASMELRERFLSLDPSQLHELRGRLPLLGCEQRDLVLGNELVDQVRRCAAGIVRWPRHDGVGQQRNLCDAHAALLVTGPPDRMGDARRSADNAV